MRAALKGLLIGMAWLCWDWGSDNWADLGWITIAASPLDLLEQKRKKLRSGPETVGRNNVESYPKGFQSNEKFTLRIFEGTSQNISHKKNTT